MLIHSLWLQITLTNEKSNLKEYKCYMIAKAITIIKHMKKGNTIGN